MDDAERESLIAATTAYHESRAVGAVDLPEKAELLRHLLGSISLGLVTCALEDRGEAYLEELAEATSPNRHGKEAQADFELFLLTGTTDPIAAAVVGGKRAARLAIEAGFPGGIARGLVLDQLDGRFTSIPRGLRAAIVAAVADGIDEMLAGDRSDG